MYYLISHVMFQKEVDIYGPVHVLEQFLLKHKQKVNIFYLPLELNGKYVKRSGKKFTSFASNYTSFIKKSIAEIGMIFSYIRSHKPNKKDTVIAVDPLNCFPFAVAKRFFNYKLIYYTPDYADKRFPNPVMNMIYKMLDRICLLSCEENWCVSERIVEKRQEQGFGNKARFLPNTPVLTEKPKQQNSKNKNKLIYVGRMDDDMKVKTIIDAVKMLRKKKQPVTLTLIGGGPLEEELKSLIKKNKLQRVIRFLGALPNTRVIAEIRKHGIGLALYSGGNYWNLYGDSMKIREYQYFGLPVITTTIPSNCRELEEYRCGEVLEPKNITSATVAKAVLTVQKNFSAYTKQAHALAKLRMKDVLLSEFLELK